MAVKKRTYKKLTKKDKEWNKQFKEDMITKGFREPDKKPLNRKKFIEETKELWEKRDTGYLYYIHFFTAVSYMIGKREGHNLRFSPEAVGVAKVLRIILRLADFHKGLKDRGETQYKIGDEYEYVKDIIEM